MAGTSYIYQFGEDCDPPYIQTDAEYLADAMRVSGWQPGVVRQEFLNKVDRQGNSIAAGLAAFMAAYESGTVDVKDDLSPTALSNILLDALSNAPLTTQPQFDDSQKVANTAFVKRALGSLASTTSYAVNTNLTAADIGKIIVPTTGGLAFGLPLVAGLPNGAQMRFNGNGHGCAIARQGSDVINDGAAGSITNLSVLEYDVIEFTVVGSAWTVTGGNEQLNASSQFAQSKTANGYIKLPGGVIIQWGKQIIPAAPTTINFPISFPTSCLIVVATDYGAGALSVSATSQTTSSFSAIARDKSLPAGGAYQGCDYNWFAVGF